ncbi:MAG TPA: DUF3795 domain-containing protein [Eubacteriales bacterium]|nr:DUF3795 domain-containing protein [Eubacteriales bacterium]
MSVEQIGCCGAYCKTCKAFTTHVCRGCKTGYTADERSLSRARCKMKICCIQKGLATCADCERYAVCETLQGFYGHDSVKYGKYRLATEYIRAHGYDAFLQIADRWNGAYGKYENR